MRARLPSGGHVRTCACPSVAYRRRSSCDVLLSRCVSERLEQQGADVVDDSFCLVPLARMDEPLVGVIERTVHGTPNVVVSHEPELAGHDVGATSCGQLVHVRIGKGMESMLAGALEAQGVNGFVDEHGKAGRGGRAGAGWRGGEWGGGRRRETRGGVGAWQLVGGDRERGGSGRGGCGLSSAGAGHTITHITSPSDPFEGNLGASGVEYV